MVMLQNDLFQLLRGYSALVPTKEFSTPSSLPFSLIHDFLLNRILLDPHLQLYPPSFEYQFSFWKWAIQWLENGISDEDVEIDTRIYDHFMSLLLASSHGLADRRAPSQSYITHFWTMKQPECSPNVVDTSESMYQTSTLFESRTTVQSGTTGLRTWIASAVLAQYMVHHPNLVHSKRILELGSGAGFLGIIVASLQQSCPSMASALCMTDINEEVLRRCRDNVQLPCNLSSSHPTVGYRLLNWSDAECPTASTALRHILEHEIDGDLILGADLVYDPVLIPPLISILCLALNRATKATEALIALTVRNEETLKEFLGVAEPLLTVTALNFYPMAQMFVGMLEAGTQDVRIFRITLKRTNIATHST